jgi:hypothetical protein
LASSYAELGQLDDAGRCIREAITAVEATKKTRFEAEGNRITSEIALEVERAGCSESTSLFPARACGRAPE